MYACDGDEITHQVSSLESYTKMIHVFMSFEIMCPVLKKTSYTPLYLPSHSEQLIPHLLPCVNSDCMFMSCFSNTCDSLCLNLEL